MKILFLIEELMDKSNPNVNIAKRIADKWIESGNEVILFCGKSEVESKFWTYERISIEEYQVYSYAGGGKALIEKLDIDKGYLKKDKISKVKCLLQNPRELFRYLAVRFTNLSIKKMVKIINKIDAVEHFDAVVSITEPYNFSKALANTSIKGKKLIYMLDPYCHNYYRNYRRYRKIEKNVMERVDGIIATELIYKQYMQDSFFKKYRNKISWLELPNIQYYKPMESIYKFDKSKINCVFAGRFYEDIRNPTPLFRLFALLDNSNIILHIWGGEGCQDEVEKYTQLLQGRMIIHDFLDSKFMPGIFQKADILINLNNTIGNQMPSKLFDYFCFGKPILNICYLEKCPSRKYTQKYPLAIDVYCDKIEDKKQKEKVENFCLNSKKKHMEYQDIEKIFYTSTPQYVAKEMLLRMECLKGKEKNKNEQF